MHLKFLILFTLILGLGNSKAQVTDNASLVRHLPAERYFRFHYDNDFFTQTDYYYTQGYAFELVHPVLRKNPLASLLVRPQGNQVQYGLAFDHFGYTPTSITAPGILLNDRPYAACILLKSFVITTDTARKRRLSSSLSIGAIGPVAAGKEIQTGIHRAISDRLPQGWRHQIKNDVLVNYALLYEHQLLQPVSWLLLSGRARGQVGSLNTNAQIGLTLQAGKFASAFAGAFQSAKPFQFYVYAQPLLNAVGYDASLQGGLFNRRSPYSLSANQLERLTLQANFGAVLMYKKVYLEYTQSILTREFNSGRKHRWGGIRIGWQW